jgi:hypothetical protein
MVDVIRVLADKIVKAGVFGTTNGATGICEVLN